MRIRCQGLLALGSELEAVVEFDGQPIPFEAKVVWRHPPDFQEELPGDMGLLIQEPPAEYLEMVARLFAKQS